MDEPCTASRDHTAVVLEDLDLSTKILHQIKIQLISVKNENVAKGPKQKRGKKNLPVTRKRRSRMQAQVDVEAETEGLKGPEKHVVDQEEEIGELGIAGYESDTDVNDDALDQETEHFALDVFDNSNKKQELVEGNLFKVEPDPDENHHEVRDNSSMAREEFPTHMQEHGSDKMEIQSSSTAGRRGKKQHDIKRKYHCKVCNKPYANVTGLRYHTMVHLNQKNFKCDLCDKAFVMNATLAKHVREVHAAEKVHKCDNCGVGFNRAYNLVRHVRNSSCKLSLLEKKKTRGPKQESTEDAPHKCETCGRGFGRYANLKRHVLSCLKIKTIQCGVCEKKFISQAALKFHMTCHSESRNYTCEFCGRAFKWLNGMKDHVKRHLNEKAFVCNICGKAMNTSSQLSMHRNVHRTTKDYACELCGSVFKHPHSLTNHMKTHMDEKTFQCKTCGKRFNTSSQLCGHRKYCSAEGRECPICNTLVKGDKRAFGKHMKTHPVLYPCEYCGKSFNRKEGLKRHRDLHLDERKYQCPVCDRAFNTYAQLESHKSRDHREMFPPKKQGEPDAFKNLGLSGTEKNSEVPNPEKLTEKALLLIT